MATLTNVIKTLNAQNDKADNRHREVIASFDKGFKDISKSIGGIRSAGIRIPGLKALTNAMVDNPITRAIGGLTKSVTNAVTAPFRLVGNLVTSLRNTMIGLFSGLAKLITQPFTALMSGLKFLFQTNWEKEGYKVLVDVLDILKTIQIQFDSYFDYLKNNRLDDLQEGATTTSDRDSPTSSTPEAKKKGGLFPALGITGLFSSIPKLLTGIGLAISAEFLGLDKFIKALFLGDTWKNLTKIPKAIVNTISTAFTNLKTRIVNLFKIPNVFPVDVGKDVAKAGGFLARVGGFFKTIGDVLSPFTKAISGVLNTAKVFARATFLLPLITLFDFVKGAITGFTEAEGGIISKLFGALEGGIKGIITGILEGVDVLKDIITFIPRKVLEALGFEKLAQRIKDFSLADMFNKVYDGAKNFISNFGENFGNLISGMGLLVKGSFKRFISDPIKNTFETIGAMFANLKDKIIIAASKVGFNLPTIKVPLPKFLGGGEFTILQGTRVALASREKAAAAADRIENRNAELIQRRNARERESSTLLTEGSQRLASTIEARDNQRTAAMINNTDARSSTTNMTILNQTSMPSVNDMSDLRSVPI